MWQQMVSVLEELVSAYDELLALAKKKHSALTRLDLKEVDGIRKEEETIVKSIGEIESRRLIVLQAISMTNPAIRAEIKRRELCLYAPDDCRGPIADLSEKLSQSVRELQRESEANTLLLKSALNAVTYKLNRVGQTIVDPGYGPSGTESATSHRRSLDFDA